MRSVQISSDRTKPVTADIRDFGLPHAGGGKIAGGLLLPVTRDRSTKQDRVYLTSLRKPLFFKQFHAVFYIQFHLACQVLSLIHSVNDRVVVNRQEED